VRNAIRFDKLLLPKSKLGSPLKTPVIRFFLK